MNNHRPSEALLSTFWRCKDTEVKLCKSINHIALTYGSHVSVDLDDAVSLTMGNSRFPF